MRAAEGRRAREPGHRRGYFGPQAEGLDHVGHHAEVRVLPQLGIEVPKRPVSFLFGDRTNPGHHRLPRGTPLAPPKATPRPARKSIRVSQGGTTGSRAGIATATALVG